MDGDEVGRLDSAPWRVVPSTSLCVAVDDGGNVVTSTDPTGGAAKWTVTNVDGAVRALGVSCPSTTLCVAADDGGGVETSTDPTGGADKWTFASFGVGDAPSAVSCGLDRALRRHRLLRQRRHVDESDGRTGAWKVTNVDSADPLTAVSCASATQCVAVDEVGNALTSTIRPAAPRPGR